MDTAADFAAQLNCLTSRDEYLAAASELLSSLVPSELVGRSFLDVETGSVELFACPARPLEAVAEKIVNTVGDNFLFLSYVRDSTPSMWEPRRLSDLATDRQLRLTRTYQEGLRPLGIDRQVALLASRPTSLSSCIWAACRWQQDFTDNEVELLAKLQPLLRLLETAYGRQALTMTGEVLEAYSLTAREQQILQLLQKGLTGLAIGHLLGISPRTVAKHLEHAYAKLGVSNRIDAINRLKAEAQ